jgi:hypothetical protein
LLLLLGLATACKADGSAAPQGKTTDSVRKLAGVYPDDWKCESTAPLAELAKVLGGVPRPIDTPMTPPRGVPHPCNYEVQAGGTYEYWTFDIDCRDNMKQRADALFEQYRSGSTDMVDQYNRAADAGALKNDAGIVYRAPEGAAEVAVGAKALDHHGQGLIFIDDDAPCYVRVVGPEAARRLELARMLAKNLTFANAPMTPRPLP